MTRLVKNQDSLEINDTAPDFILLSDKAKNQM